MNASDVVASLRKYRYPAAEWASFVEVPSGAGSSWRRRCDLIALNTWPSRGLALEGVEVKVSASDLRKEIRTPDKAEELARFVDAWFIAVPHTLPVDTGALPAGWGLLFCSDKGVTLGKEPQRLGPRELTRSFFAALARAAARERDQVIATKLADEVSRRVAEVIESERAVIVEKAQRPGLLAAGNFESLRRSVDELVVPLGLTLHELIYLARNPMLRALATTLHAGTFVRDGPDLARHFDHAAANARRLLDAAAAARAAIVAIRNDVSSFDPDPSRNETRT